MYGKQGLLGLSCVVSLSALSCSHPTIVEVSVSGIPLDATTLQFGATLGTMTAEPTDFTIANQTAGQFGLRVPAGLKGAYQVTVSALQRSGCTEATGQAVTTLSGATPVMVQVALAAVASGTAGACGNTPPADGGTGDAGTGGCAAGSGVCWQNPLPRAYVTSAVHGVSATDLWAVGELGLALHYDGSAWTQVPTGTSAVLRGVYAAASANVWAVGDAGTLLNWNGTAWSPAPAATTDTLNAVSGDSPSDIFAVGEQVILRYDGTTWTAIPQSGDSLLGVYVRPGGEVWTVGANQTSGAIASVALRSPGGSAAFTALPALPAATGFTRPPQPALYSVWANATNDAWVTGDGGTDQSGATVGGVLYHYNGTSFSFVTSPALSTGALYGLGGLGSQDVWAVGQAGLVVRWNGTSWTQVAAPSDMLLSGMWLQADTDLWVAGYGTALQWNGASWGHGASTGSTTTLLGLGGTGAKDIWAVGHLGTILHSSGQGFTASPSGTTQGLYGVWASAAQDAWAVGNGGTVLHWNGSAWSSATSATTSLRACVWGSGASDVWAGGASVFTHWDGSKWSQVSGAVAQTIYGLSGTGSGDVWAAGAMGTVEHWAGGAWTQDMTVPVSDDLHAVWDGGTGNVWVVGDNSDVLNNAGGSFNLVDGPFAGDLYGVWGTGSGEVWVGGDSGLWRTDDNGATWISVDIGTSTLTLAAVWGQGGDGPFAAGTGGMVLGLPR